MQLTLGHYIGSNLFADSVRAVSRYFIFLESSSVSYYEFTNPLVPSGDFTITVEFSTMATGVQALCQIGQMMIRQQTATQINVFPDIAGGPVSYSGANFADGKLHTLVLVGTNGGTVTSLSIDGVAYTSSGSGASVDMSGSNNLIGKWQGGSFYEGILANFVLDDIDGAETMTFVLNQPELDTELAVEAIVGSEAWIDPPSNVDSDWTDNGGGSYSYIGDGSFNQLEDNVLTTSTTFLIEFDVDSITGTMKVFSGTISETFATTGRKSFLFVNTASTSIGFARNSGTVNCSLSNITAKSVSSAVQYNDVAASQRELYTVTNAGAAWLGEEVWDDGTVTGVGGDWSFAGGGVYDLNGSSGTLIAPANDYPDFNYRSVFTWSKISGDLKLGSNGVQIINASGDYSIDGADNTAIGFKRNSGTVVGELSGISIKRLIEIA